MGNYFPKKTSFFSPSEKTFEGNKYPPYFPGMYNNAVNILSLSNHLAPIFECYSVQDFVLAAGTYGINIVEDTKIYIHMLIYKLIHT